MSGSVVPRDNSFAIVMVGHWNLYILTPEWIAANIFEGDENIRVDVPFNFGLPFKYTSDKHKVMFMPTSDRVTFISLSTSDENINKLGAFASRLASKLTATPVSAFGINFGFTENEPSEFPASLFKFADNEALGDIKSSSINRKFVANEKALNLNVSMENKKINFDFNFHYETDKISTIENETREAVARNFEIAKDILGRIYGYKITEARGN